MNDKCLNAELENYFSTLNHLNAENFIFHKTHTRIQFLEFKKLLNHLENKKVKKETIKLILQKGVFTLEKFEEEYSDIL